MSVFLDMFQKEYYVYILKCKDGLYYTGVTGDIQKRYNQHKEGFYKSCFTYKRRPIKIVFLQSYSSIEQAIQFEKKIKGWSRRKKKALIEERWSDLIKYSKNYTDFGKLK
jgi:putative endonuclease